MVVTVPMEAQLRGTRGTVSGMPSSRWMGSVLRGRGGVPGVMDKGGTRSLVVLVGARTQGQQDNKRRQSGEDSVERLNEPLMIGNAF